MASFVLAGTVAAADPVAPIIPSGKQVPAVGVVGTSVSPSLACLARSSFRVDVIYYSWQDPYHPNTVNFSGSACLNGSQSWSTGGPTILSGTTTPWSFIGSPGHGAYNIGGTTEWWVNINTPNWGAKYPRVDLYQSGTTWYLHCFDNAGLASCSFY